MQILVLACFQCLFYSFLQFEIFLYTAILVSSCTLGGKRRYVNVFVKAFFSAFHQKVFKFPFIFNALVNFLRTFFQMIFI